MERVEKVHFAKRSAALPVLNTGIRVGVESKNGVMLGRHEDHVVNPAVDAQTWNPERLRKDSAIHRAGKKFSESVGVHGGGR